MRATRCLSLVLLVMALATGCIAWQAPVQPPRGLLLTHYRAPLTGNVTNVPADGKVGTYSTRFFHDILFTGGTFAWDDASIKAAAREGGLSKVYYADYEVLNILGIYAQFTVRAYGE